MSEFWLGFLVGFFWLIVLTACGMLAFATYLFWGIAQNKAKYLKQTLSDTDMKK